MSHWERPYAMEAECLKSDFCAPNDGKKWKREDLGWEKAALELKEMDFKQIIFLTGIACLFLFCFSIFKWLLMITMLSTKYCL